ncbi:transcription or splicing factor-like protein, putative [Plasmodium relictum]|uniref:Branchpoint-bridging protein n=1 Tax=Plasmodium relictum TaxID=85471 RepID=A0A1J1H8M7_PLARL|nr:transcription or splicing factor-like protein, putative [Plasmodium relictum]CRH00902.1 transcription or splicing factor-like protein, putative [Plasmodium relictum]
MYYDPLVALVNISPVEKLSEENAKKKSRWENNLSNNNIENKMIPSKWGSEDYKPYLPLPFVDFPPGLTPSQLDQFLREQRYDELTKKLNKGELEYVDPDIRPPSPPPIYDKNGSRINTREARIKNSMIEEHHRLVEYLLKHVEGFVAPPNYKPIKKIRKIEIPIDKYPEYNFMGLIIGPRGCNHKRLEAESGAQISIRGKGTQKEGKKTDHQTEIEANMPKHVHISADSEECVEKAVSLITPLLDPFHPLHEEYKRKGLEQLALVNGINLNQLDTQRCSICNSMTHLTFECPENMNLQNFKKPEIKCNLCGDHGHITLDCKLAKQKNYIKNDIDNPNNIPTPPYNNMPPPPFDQMKNQQFNPTNKFDKIKMDLEYQKMMNEISTDKNNNNQQNDELSKKSNDNIFNNNNVADDFMKPPNSFNNLNEINNSFNESTTNFVDINNKFQNSLQNNSKSFNNMMSPVNNKNINNPNFIPISQNNSFIDEKRNSNSPNYFDPHLNNRNPPIRNSNGKNFNTMMNFPNINNMPLNPPLPILPNFFNFPFINNRMVQNNSMPFPNNQQMPIDPLYMQNFQNWPQMPMNYSDDTLIHAPAPETNPPPLPSENININNQDNANNT